MSNDWVDSYDGEVSGLGSNPYGFNGELTSKLPAQQQQGAGMGGTLSGLAAALMKYGNSGSTLGSSSAGTYYPTQAGTSDNAFLGGEDNGISTPYY